MFQRINTTRGFEEVARQIQQVIVDGKLRPGDRLPSLRELMEAFQASKACVLEALHVLEKAGLITLKQGAAGGAFVREPTTDRLTESLELLLKLKRVSLEELAEFRERLEAGTASWAAERASIDDIEGMHALLTKLDSLLADNDVAGQTITDTDILFHFAVAKASQNELSVAVMHAIHNSMTEAFYLIPRAQFARMRDDLHSILEAIGSKNAALAEARMRSHIAFFSRLEIESARKGSRD